MKIGLFYFCFLLGMVAQGQSLPAISMGQVYLPAVVTNPYETDLQALLHSALQSDPHRFSYNPIFSGRQTTLSPEVFQIFLDKIPVPHGLIYVSEATASKSVLTFPMFNYSHPGVLEGQMEATSKIRNETPVAVYQNGKWKVFYKRGTHQMFPVPVSKTEYFDATGTLAFVEDGFLHLHANEDSTVRASVFKPDPSTKLRRNYGNGLKDSADRNSALLVQALDTVLLQVHFENDTFSLKNSKFEMGEFSPPILPLTRTRANNLCFTRDTALFEEVNVFYHLNKFRQLIDSIGFNTLADYPLRVDAHGMDGADQSAYSPVLDILAYGTGNVDDGEDAAVVVHEYGHVLAHAAFPFGNAGQERRAVEEGICDYLAGSYARNISDWEWQRLFKWDGWNEFWPGRNLLSTKHYPENLVGQIHRDGEIFSSALMNIELVLGREVTHRLVLQALFSLGPNLSMPQAAFSVLRADSLLFSGSHSQVINAIFQGKGIAPGNIIVGLRPENLPASQSIAGYLVNSDDFVSLKPLIGDEWNTISLCDITGKIIRSVTEQSNSEQFKISTAGIPPGCYLIMAQSNIRGIWQPAKWIR